LGAGGHDDYRLGETIVMTRWAIRYAVVRRRNATPLPATLPLFATGIGGLGLLGWRRKRKARSMRSETDRN
jgi:hypothetical protein